MERQIEGALDEFSFPFIGVVVCNPVSGKEIVIKAIIDTGAAHCLVQQPIIEELRLTKIGVSTYLNPVKGELQTEHYIIDLIVDIHNPGGSSKLQQMRVSTFNEMDYPASMIIGADFLKYCQFFYSGVEKKFTLNFKI